MKRTIRFVLLVLFLCHGYGPCTAHAATNDVLATGNATGTTQVRFSTVDGTAFIDGNGTIPVANWVGEELEVCDSAKRCIRGHISAVGAGETLGSEIATGTLTVKLLYKITATEANHFYTGCAIGGYFTSLGTETCDSNNKVKQVTAPSATGAVITNKPGGSQNWSFKHALFDPNSASAYSWRILKSKPLSREIASGTVTSSNVHLATVDGGAMVEISGVDLSPYAGTDTTTEMSFVTGTTLGTLRNDFSGYV